MSTNARTWFYQEPEAQPYLVSERLNGTFWQARMTDMYWRCTSVEPPLQADGYLGEHIVHLEWVPGQWLKLKAPQEMEKETLISVISDRILGIPATVTYSDHQGHVYYEWHRDDAAERWREIQGQPEFVQPQRL